MYHIKVSTVSIQQELLLVRIIIPSSIVVDFSSNSFIKRSELSLLARDSRSPLRVKYHVYMYPISLFHPGEDEHIWYFKKRLIWLD
jgi:uncharacterized protein YcfL